MNIFIPLFQLVGIYEVLKDEEKRKRLVHVNILAFIYSSCNSKYKNWPCDYLCINYHKHISTCLYVRYRYHLVLENGLPDWRQPIYYYRRVRKMGLAEFFALIFVITTVGQYIVMWAVYAERKFTLVRYLYNVLCSIYTEQSTSVSYTHLTLPTICSV